MEDKHKKILLIGGALLIGAVVLSQQRPDVIGGGVGTVTDLITGFTITQDEPTKKEDTITGGGDTVYNVTYPEVPQLVLPEPTNAFLPSFNGGGGGATQLTDTKKAATVTEKGKTVSDIQARTSGMGDVIRQLQETKTRKYKEVKMPMGLPSLFPFRGVVRMGG